jgi:hypothetical protein
VGGFGLVLVAEPGIDMTHTCMPALVPAVDPVAECRLLDLDIPRSDLTVDQLSRAWRYGNTD